MSDNEQKQVNIEDMTPQQSLEALWTLMNKAASKGCFSIDESYVLKILFSKVSKHIVESSKTKSSEVKYDLSNSLDKSV